MLKDPIASLCAAHYRPATMAAVGVLVLAICASSTAARADELQALRNVGDGYKAVRVITHYEIHAGKRSFDLTAAEPSVPTTSKAVEKQLAGETAREICANRAIGAGWTVRMFLPGETTPAASCRTGARR
jgi:hypothetical protein